MDLNEGDCGQLWRNGLGSMSRHDRRIEVALNTIHILEKIPGGFSRFSGVPHVHRSQVDQARRSSSNGKGGMVGYYRLPAIEVS